VVLGFADATSTTGFLALLGTVTDTMTGFAAEETGDDDLFTVNLLLGAILGLVADLLTVAAFVNTTVEWDTGIFKALEILLGGSRPQRDQSRTLRFVGGEVAHCILPASVALKVDKGPGVTNILLLWQDVSWSQGRRQAV
jgi:hypothetical protein